MNEKQEKEMINALKKIGYNLEIIKWIVVMIGVIIFGVMFILIN